MHQLAWLSPRMHSQRTANSKSLRQRRLNYHYCTMCNSLKIHFGEDPVPGLLYANIRAVLGMIYIPSYRRKQAGICYWDAALHPLTLAAQIFPQNRAPTARSHPEPFFLPLDSQDTLEVFSASWPPGQPGVWVGRSARLPTLLQSFPIRECSCSHFSRELQSTGDFIKQPQIHSSRCNYNNFQ